MDNLQLISHVITLLDQLVIQGARNAAIIAKSVEELGVVQQNLMKEKNDVQDQAQ